MHSFSRATCGRALLTGFALLAAPTAKAQFLTLGQYGDMRSSGTATLINNGTTVGGTYTYESNNSTVPLVNQNHYSEWDAYGHSAATVYGGNIGSLTTADTSKITVMGGTIAAYLRTYGYSMVTISGGSVTNLTTTDTSTVDVSGGTLNGLVTYDSSVLDLFGRSLTTTFDYSGIDGGDPLTLYTVTGTLRNGDPLSTLYYDFGGTLEFNGVPAVPIPEASSVISLGLLLLLGAGGIAVSRRRRAGGVR